MTFIKWLQTYEPSTACQVHDDDDIPAGEREALLRIARGAVVTGGGLSIQRVLGTATEFVLATALGPVAYGVYALAWRISQILFRLVNGGTVPTLQRFVPAYVDESGRQNRIVGLAYATTIVTGVAIVGVLVVGANRISALTISEPHFPPTLRLFGAVVVLVGIVKTYAAVLRAVGNAKREFVFNRLLRPATRLASAVGAVVLGYSVVGVAGALVLGTGALALAGYPGVVRTSGVRSMLRDGRSEWRDFFHHAAPVALSSLGKVFQNRVDILLVGALLTATEAGVYSVVLVLVAVARIPLQSFNQLFAPVASDLHSRGERQTLDDLYTSVTRLALTAAVPVVAVEAVFDSELLAVFGSTYAVGYAPLAIYLGGVLAGSAVGGTGWLLMMTDRPYVRMVLDWVLAGSNVVLTYLFVSRFGLAGAALGTTVAITVQNGIQILLLRHFEGLWPFDATFLKPLSAGVVMVGLMIWIRTALGGVSGLTVGLLLWLGAYLATWQALGVDERDRLVVQALIRYYRQSVIIVFR
jgi:O-antigen/teichoic acid export membrane protein